MEGVGKEGMAGKRLTCGSPDSVTSTFLGSPLVAALSVGMVSWRSFAIRRAMSPPRTLSSSQACTTPTTPASQFY